MTTPTPEAIEAAAIAYFVAVQPNRRKPEDWDHIPGVWKKSYRDQSTAALTAAAPLIAAQALRDAADAFDYTEWDFTADGMDKEAGDNIDCVGVPIEWLRARAATLEGEN